MYSTYVKDNQLTIVFAATRNVRNLRIRYEYCIFLCYVISPIDATPTYFSLDLRIRKLGKQVLFCVYSL